jgi:hypothetical protein
VPIGTFCSGTDATLFVYIAFAEAASEIFSIEINIIHEFATEYDVPKQQFILDQWPLVKKLFNDVTKLGAATAHDVKSSTQQPVPAIITGLGGFSCKDASGLNPKSATVENRMAVAEAGCCFVLIERLPQLCSQCCQYCVVFVVLFLS